MTTNLGLLEKPSQDAAGNPLEDSREASEISARMFARASKAIANQSFSQLLGARLEVFEPGRAELSLPVTAKLLQQHGFVHGGVVAYMADNTLTLAGGTVLENVVTGEMKINYLRPATNADSLLAIATVVGHGKTQAVCRCEVYIVKDGQRKLCAAAQGTINKVLAPTAAVS